MGTINYYTSDYITLGVNCNNIESDDDYYFLQDDYEQIENILYNEHFKHIIVTLEPGYYEGFSININFDYLYFDDCDEKREAQREITRVKAFLSRCINDFNLCACSPGWCTAYYDYKESLKQLNAAIKEMRATVKNTPTAKNFDFKKIYA